MIWLNESLKRLFKYEKTIDPLARSLAFALFLVKPHAGRLEVLQTTTDDDRCQRPLLVWPLHYVWAGQW